jgi:hypothetical protein
MRILTAKETILVLMLSGRICETIKSCSLFVMRMLCRIIGTKYTVELVTRIVIHNLMHYAISDKEYLSLMICVNFQVHRFHGVNISPVMSSSTKDLKNLRRKWPRPM